MQQRRVDAAVAQLAAEFEIDATRGGPARVQVNVLPLTGEGFTLTQDVVLDPAATR